MKFSWTRTTAGIVNAEGNLIVFGVTLTNNEFFHRPNVDVAATVGRNEYVGEVQKWRARDDGTIFARDGTDPELADGGLMEAPDVVGNGSDLLLGDIYRWVVKGATPVAWNPEVYRKVAAAFDYGTGRVLPSRVCRNPRCARGVRV